MDVISRKVAIDAIHSDILFKPLPNNSFYRENHELVTIGYVERILSAVPSAHQWIPCDKGEPDEDMECWVTVKTTNTLFRGRFTKRYGERRDKGFITSGGFMWWNTALAWMPIYEPEPYRKDNEADD